MEKSFELSKLSNETLLELYKKADAYIAFLQQEKKSKSTEE
jgi:hypothetical protein